MLVFSDNFDEYINAVEIPLGKLIWILFTILAIIFFAVGCFMLRRIRLYFKGFYKEFGCQLWTANVLLTLPLTFRAIFDALRYDSAWENYWILSENYYRLCGYNLLLFTFGTYIPMMMQIASLIFGFVRHKKVKVFRSFAGDRDDKTSPKQS